jgi:hypothetical protein
MRKNDLEQYQRAHEQIMLVPRNMSRLLLSLDGRKNFRRRVLRALEREPAAFDQMLAIHLGTSTVRQIPMGQALRLGWKIMHASE